jgi:hypothetical protein
MANRLMKQFPLTLEAGVCKLFGSCTTTTSGTVGSQSGKGFTITKVGATAGRYLVSFQDKYTSLLGIAVTLQGSTTAAYTAAKGLCHMIRVENVAGAVPSLLIQFQDPATSLDAEVADGAKFFVEVTLKNSSAY